MKRFKSWLLNKRIERTKRMLIKVDSSMKAIGMPRWKRRQIWRDFIKSDQSRAGMIDILNGAIK